MSFLPSSLNVNVKKFKQARVNRGSNYDFELLEFNPLNAAGNRQVLEQEPLLEV